MIADKERFLYRYPHFLNIPLSRRSEDTETLTAQDESARKFFTTNFKECWLSGNRAKKCRKIPK